MALRCWQRGALPLACRPCCRSVVSEYSRTISSFSTEPIGTSVLQNPPTSSPQPSSSVDQTEIQHFNNLAASWWDPHGSSRLLHLMNPIRHDFIRSCHGQRPEIHHQQQRDGTEGEKVKNSRQLRYLDVGCGGGIFAESAARMPDTDYVVGIDASAAVIEVARKHASADELIETAERRGQAEKDTEAAPSQLWTSDPKSRPRLTYINTTIESLPPPPSQEEGFDVVSLFEVLEHVNNPGLFLSVAAKQVKPGGWLVGSTIGRTAVSWVTTKLMAEHLLGIVPVGTHDWNKYINADELQAWLGALPGRWTGLRMMGVMYIPAFGWARVPDGLPGKVSVGNYFFGIQRLQ